jgi:RNA polymerase sigma-70 factor (ECF subfamily)
MFMTDHTTTPTPLAGRTNHEWVRDLQGAEQDSALSDLRALLLRGLRAALYTHIHEGLDSILEDFVQEALIKILNNLDTFRGESRFTTWAQKIAVNVAFTELRRRRWQNVSLQDMIDRYDSNDFTPAILTDPGFSPEKRATLRIVMETLNTLIEENLTDKQREAIQAVILGGAPMEEVAQRMGTNRNALYKLLHDARKRLKQHLLDTGISPEEILAIFDHK